MEKLKSSLLREITSSILMKRIQRILSQDRALHMTGIYGSFLSLLICALQKNMNEPVCVVCDNSTSGERLLKTIAFAGREISVFFENSQSCVERFQTLYDLKTQKKKIFLFSLKALEVYRADIVCFDSSFFTISLGDVWKRGDLLKRFIRNGYCSSSRVSCVGEFSCRGEIIDCFSPSQNDPIRFEFSEDIIENIWAFDWKTQRIKTKSTHSTIDFFPILSDENQKKISQKKIFFDRISDDVLTILLDPMTLSRDASSLGIVGFSPDEFLSNSIQKKITMSFLNPEQSWIDKTISMDRETSQLMMKCTSSVKGIPSRDFLKKKLSTDYSTPLYELKEGDFVVHLSYGIAKYHGLSCLKNQESVCDYMKLEFAKNSIFYVPVEDMDLIQKYIGLEKKNPQMSILHGSTWVKEKLRVEKSIKHLAIKIIRIQAQRQSQKSFSYQRFAEWEKLLEENFPYQETEDQLKAIKDVFSDMESTRPMDRLICGNAGYGKTEVALRSVFCAVLNNKQVMLLVPTTLLADQHFRYFRERLKDLPVSVEMLSRFRKKKEQKMIVKELKRGAIDIIIGTHRVLQPDVDFKNLSLVIIDEEHRFGVVHKELIKEYRNSIDILTMSATPIPRTLAFSLMGIRDISLLSTPPCERVPLHIEIIFFNESVVKEAILRETSRKGQVFFIHNRVEDIDKVTEKIKCLIHSDRVQYVHGQMHENDIEQVMLDFIEHRFDVLVCTVIVESGLDISNANTIIIDNSDMFGVADLYQLCGRVGRGNRQAYAYLTVDARKPLTDVAESRLKIIKESHSQGNSYNIALRDLDTRGAGNILGAEQSGHIFSIGFSLYCSLLNKYLKSAKSDDQYNIPTNIHLGLQIKSYPEYIQSNGARLDVYRSIMSITSENERQEIFSSIQDLYGKDMPNGLLLLFDLVKLKIIAGSKQYLYIGRRGNLIECVDASKHFTKIIPEKNMEEKDLLKWIESFL